jgi:hypothetical protein
MANNERNKNSIKERGRSFADDTAYTVYEGPDAVQQQ